MTYPDCEFAIVKDVENINYKPHPFVIGCKHVAHAADHYGGVLDETTLKAIPCAHPGCRLSYDEHTCDHVAFIQLKRNATQDEFQGWAQAILVPWLEKVGLDGIVLVETPEKFRVGDDYK